MALRGHSCVIITSNICVFILMFNVITSDSTVNIGQVVSTITGSRCRVGTVYKPTSCTRCVCGLLNLMLCSQTCVPSQGESSTPESRPPASGPTVIPILIPNFTFIRLPIPFSANSSKYRDVSVADDAEYENTNLT